MPGTSRCGSRRCRSVVATIVSDADDYAGKVRAACEKAGLRAESDLRNEKINYKVREHSLAKVPVMLVVGKREAEEQTVSVRRLGSQEQETCRWRGRPSAALRRGPAARSGAKDANPSQRGVGEA